MTNKKRILIFSTAYIPFIGGAEVAIKEITDRLSGDFEFDLITLNLDGKQKRSEKIGSVNVYRIGRKGRISKLLFPFISSRLASKLHRQNPYDLIWSMMASFSGFAALFFKKKFPSVRYLLTLQEGDSISEIKRKARFVYPWFRQVFTSADYIQAISNYLADWAKDMGAKGIISVVPNGVDVARFANSGARGTKHEVILITTSRLVEKNAVGDIINSLKYPSDNVKLQILGSGPLEAELRNLAKKENLDHRVKFVGFVSQENIPKYLHKADIFIRPSLSEGQGISFLEAMAAGLPVIATPVGGIPDFLKDGETGLFCDVNNPKSIAEKVKELAGDPNLRYSIVKNAFQMVKEKYDWNVVTEDMKRIFQDL